MAAIATAQAPVQPQRRAPRGTALSLRAWDLGGSWLTNLLAVILLFAYLFPMVYMLGTAFKSDAQLRDVDSPWWPGEVMTTTYNGQQYDVYAVPTDQGVKNWALIERRRQNSDFVDPAHPEQGLITWQGNWRMLKRVYQFKLDGSSFAALFQVIPFGSLAYNTAYLIVVCELGVLVSSVLVAYGFARFPVPGGKILFMLMIATLIIPEKITLIPSYMMYVKLFPLLGLSALGLGTYWPIILPQWFGNAIAIFLLHQNFKVIPKEQEEAAMLDGAGPLRILTAVIIPQCMPTIVTVGLLQLFYLWNETRLSSLYLSTTPEKYTVSFYVQQYQQYFPTDNQLQASALLIMVVPLIALLLAQRVFMQDVRVTGAEKSKDELKKRASA